MVGFKSDTYKFESYNNSQLSHWAKYIDDESLDHELRALVFEGICLYLPSKVEILKQTSLDIDGFINEGNDISFGFIKNQQKNIIQFLQKNNLLKSTLGKINEDNNLLVKSLDTVIEILGYDLKKESNSNLLDITFGDLPYDIITPTNVNVLGGLYGLLIATKETPGFNLNGSFGIDLFSNSNSSVSESRLTLENINNVLFNVNEEVVITKNISKLKSKLGNLCDEYVQRVENIISYLDSFKEQIDLTQNLPKGSSRDELHYLVGNTLSTAVESYYSNILPQSRSSFSQQGLSSKSLEDIELLPTIN